MLRRVLTGDGVGLGGLSAGFYPEQEVRSAGQRAGPELLLLLLLTSSNILTPAGEKRPIRGNQWPLALLAPEQQQVQQQTRPRSHEGQTAARSWVSGGTSTPQTDGNNGTLR